MYGPRMTTRYSFCWDSARLESRRFRTNNRVMSDKQPLSGVPGKRDSWEFHVHLAAKRPMHRSAGRCSPEVRIWEAWRPSADHSRETPFHEIGQTDRSLPLPRRHPGEVAARRHSWISGALEKWCATRHPRSEERRVGEESR